MFTLKEEKLKINKLNMQIKNLILKIKPRREEGRKS